MHRLVPGPHVPRIDARGHRFDALSVPRQAQPGEVGPQRLAAIRMPQGQRQPLQEVMKPAFAGVVRVSHAAMLAWYPRKLLYFVTQ